MHLAGKYWLTPSIDNTLETRVNLAALILGLKWMSLFLSTLHASLNFPFILNHDLPQHFLSISNPNKMSLVRALRCDQMFQTISYDSSIKIQTQFCLEKLRETFLPHRIYHLLGRKVLFSQELCKYK